MSVLHPSRPSALDEAERLLQRHLRRRTPDLQPDPLFGRRLRGTILNNYVATREGSASVAAPERTRMGSLGRACLYASVLVASGVGGTMAASQGALPGDALYPMKIQVEQLRLRALPVELHDDLAAAMLAERVWELGMLVEAGDQQAATAMASDIEAAIDRLAGHGMAALDSAGPVAPQLEVLRGLMDRLPAAAETAIERRIEEAAARETRAAEPPSRGAQPVRSENAIAPNDRGLIRQPAAGSGHPPNRAATAEEAPGRLRGGPPPSSIDEEAPAD